jgi:CRISPR/Cas system-associated exonuclease Cas4 (RecB family)
MNPATTSPRLTHVHFSKSAYGLFEMCPLKYSYTKVERREPDYDDDPSEALLIGNAGHEAIAALLNAGSDPATDPRSPEIAREVIVQFGLPVRKVDGLLDGVLEAAMLAYARRGRVDRVESLESMLRIPAATVWGKFDAVVVDGNEAPVEVIDWTFGRARAHRATDLLTDMGTMLYRLIAGDVYQDQAARPIAITQVAVMPTPTALTVKMTREDVEAAWLGVKAAIEAVRLAIDTGNFPPRPGNHCAYCPFRGSCAAAAPGAGSD